MLDKIRDYLVENKIKVKYDHLDGRINSAIMEDDILKIIKKEFNIIIPDKREWFDFSYIENNIFYPINLKITKLSTDNLNCKLGLYYSLTNKLPDFHNEITWNKYFQKLSNNISNYIESDYYFLVIVKENTDNIFINSLHSLNSITPNGNNLPFQCNWSLNKYPIKKTFEESKHFLINNLYKSIKLRNKTLIDFENYFYEFKN